LRAYDGLQTQPFKAFMRPVDRLRFLRDILAPARLTTVVDVGANPLNGKPPYALMLRAGVVRIIGFEPQADVLQILTDQAGPNETYLPYAVGSGSLETLYVTRNSGLVSTLEPEPWIGDYLNPWWRRATEIRNTVSMKTERLDDMPEIDTIDFLKIDIQGGELAVFQGARAKLASTAVIQTEVAILSYYKNQPTFGDIQHEMTQQGFLLHKFAEISGHRLGYPAKLAPGLELTKSQVTTADVIYLRNPVDMTRLDTECLRHMAMIADGVLRSFDLVLRCLGELSRRNVVTPTDISRYVAALESGGLVRRGDSAAV
jgi:FkbM family methyltransferase